mgnify:FL=1
MHQPYKNLLAHFPHPLSQRRNDTLTQIKVVCTKSIQGEVQRLLNLEMIRVIELRRQEDLAPLHARVFDPLPHLCLVTVRRRGIDVWVPNLEGMGDRSFDIARLGLPCALLQE